MSEEKEKIEPIKEAVGQSEYGTAVSDKGKDLGKPAIQVGRAGKPTAEDVPTVQDPSDVLKKSDDLKTPQERARQQAQEQKLSKKKIKEGLSEVDDLTEMGDKVHNLTEDGSRLEVQSHDKSNSVPVVPQFRTGNIIKKRKVSFLFPGINPDVAQKALRVTINENPFNENDSEPYTVDEVFPPDVSNKEVLLPLNSRIHVELFHVDAQGYFSHPYILDFYTMIVPEFTRPLQASPIGYELMEEVNVYE